MHPVNTGCIFGFQWRTLRKRTWQSQRLIALENFDAIGAWREEALVINPDTAAQSFSPVDSSTVLPSGEDIEDSSDLVSFLVDEREEEFTRSLTWHLVTYALARAPNLGDEIELDAIHRHFRTSGYKLPALVLAIVQSEVFQASGGPAMDLANTLQIKNSPRQQH